MADIVTILGMESSCDDTAAAILRVQDGEPEILSSVVVNQNSLHADFGGVVPEIAARAHTERFPEVINRALQDAQTDLTQLSAIAVTAGPGLIGGVLAGVMHAKGLSAATGLPLVGVNHLAGHALTSRLSHGVDYPYLMLLVSGGHCQFLHVKGPTEFERMGGTIDDAPGEAFDKAARLLGLPQPGGPSVEKAARDGDASAFKLPRPLLDRSGLDMSFSGLKTALLRARDQVIEADGGLSNQARADLCASFQLAVGDVLAEKSRRALAEIGPVVKGFCVAGGVASNQALRSQLETISSEANTPFIAPPLPLCTDNAAMIAYAGYERYALGLVDDFSLKARPRWPLDEHATPLLGSGKKGAKA